MNIDEAKKISKEHDALEILQERIFAFRDSARPEATDPAPFGVEDKDLNYLVPLLERRIKELALMFQPEAAPVNPVRQITVESGRPKVKPAVTEKWAASLGGDGRLMTEELWRVWADRQGFKWGSVANVLRELRAEQLRAERDARLKAERHDNDLRKDASADLPSGVFHAK